MLNRFARNASINLKRKGVGVFQLQMQGNLIPPTVIKVTAITNSMEENMTC